MPRKQSVTNIAMANVDDDNNNDDDDMGNNASGMKEDEKSDDIYKKRRIRNNIAVRKCRNKNRMKAKETIDRVTRLRQENQDLQQKILTLNKELNLLKDMFIGQNSSVEEEPSNVGPNAETNTKLYTDHEYSITHKTIKSE
ncbi:CCAAT/enhancer-binding protein homolog 2 [Argonauta hians]